jgi:hydroxypyruvate isomerase
VRFDVNIHTLFTEVPLLERFALVREAGFEAVESWWPIGTDPEAYAAAVADADLDLVLLNFFGGDPAGGDRGVLSDLERFVEFRENVPVALGLAAATGCEQMNALVGLEKPEQARDDQLKLAVENVRWAADLGAEQGVQVLIEPLNPFDNGPCLIQTIGSAIDFISSVDRPNVRLQFDAYHVKRTESAVSPLIGPAGPFIAHVQIADAPGRGAPGSGSIDFYELFRELHQVGYDRHVGLEYFSDGPAERSLEWLPRYMRRGFHAANAVMAAVAGGQ